MADTRIYHNVSSDAMTQIIAEFEKDGSNVVGENPWDIEFTQKGIKLYLAWGKDILTARIKDKSFFVSEDGVWNDYINPLVENKTGHKSKGSSKDMSVNTTADVASVSGEFSTPEDFAGACLVGVNESGILSVKCGVRDKNTGQVHVFERTADLNPITQILAKRMADYHNKLHADMGSERVAGANDFLDRAGNAAEQAAVSVAQSQLFKIVADVYAPGARQTAGLLAKQLGVTNDIVTAAAEGSPLALNTIAQVKQQADAGQPGAQTAYNHILLVKRAQANKQATGNIHGDSDSEDTTVAGCGGSVDDGTALHLYRQAHVLNQRGVARVGEFVDDMHLYEQFRQPKPRGSARVSGRYVRGFSPHRPSRGGRSVQGTITHPNQTTSNQATSYQQGDSGGSGGGYSGGGDSGGGGDMGGYSVIGPGDPGMSNPGWGDGVPSLPDYSNPDLMPGQGSPDFAYDPTSTMINAADFGIAGVDPNTALGFHNMSDWGVEMDGEWEKDVQRSYRDLQHSAYDLMGPTDSQQTVDYSDAKLNDETVRNSQLQEQTISGIKLGRKLKSAYKAGLR